nr:hypothetical protein [Brevundimonas goettingensis]
MNAERLPDNVLIDQHANIFVARIESQPRQQPVQIDALALDQLHELAAMEDQQAAQFVAAVVDVRGSQNLGDRQDRTAGGADASLT